MKNKLFKTLFARMLTTYLAVVLGLLLLMAVTVVGMFQRQYLEEKEQELWREAEEINTILVEKYVYDEKRPVAREELRTIARKHDALIQVIDLNGDLMVFFDPESADKWSALEEWTYPVNTMEMGQISDHLFEGLTDLPILSAVRAVENQGQQEGVILLHVDMSSVNASIRKVYLEVLLTGLVAILAAVLAVYYLTTHITRPITDMNKTVQKYTKGEFDVRVPVSGTDEVAQLADSFNTMADEVNGLENARRNFVANVSHELRSPLTSMRGFLEAMRDGTIPPAERDKYLDVVINETKRMTSMVNDLLDLARIESGKSVLHPEVFDINELLRRTLITFETRIGEKTLDVGVDFAEELCYVEADPTQIAQVLRNLIDNAIKFSPEKGMLRLCTRVDKQLVYVRVQDYGRGIPKEDLPHIFERFYKAEKAHTPSSQSGTGLGLAIVQRIVAQHGQTIRVESDPQNGTVFEFTLKRVLEQNRRKHAMQADEG